jgi:hypothetical protein
MVPALEVPTLGCTHNNTLQVLQRTVLGPAPPKRPALSRWYSQDSLSTTSGLVPVVLINVLMLPAQLKVMYYKLVVLSRQPVHHQWSSSGGIDKCINASGSTPGHAL